MSLRAIVASGLSLSEQASVSWYTFIDADEVMYSFTALLICTFKEVEIRVVRSEEGSVSTKSTTSSNAWELLEMMADKTVELDRAETHHNRSYSPGNTL